MKTSVDTRPRLYCNATAATTVLAVPHEFALSVRLGDLVLLADESAIERPGDELVRVTEIQTILGKDEALLHVLRGMSGTDAIGHERGAILLRLSRGPE